MIARARLGAATLALLALHGRTLAQDPTPAPEDPTPVQATPANGATAGAGAGPEWSVAATVLGYFVPDDDLFASPIVYVDRDQLHLEARYNYEERGAGSLFAGWTFSAGEMVTVDVTPMLGGVFGDLSAIAPAFELDVKGKRWNYYIESEWVIDLNDDQGDFLYSWSELAWSPADWFRVGLVGQRTRLYETGLDIQRGLLVGFSHRRLEITAYFFNPGGDDSFIVGGLSYEF